MPWKGAYLGVARVWWLKGSKLEYWSVGVLEYCQHT
jgi:hypothetical protein